MLQNLIATLKARHLARRAAAYERRRRELLNSKPGVHPVPDDDPLFITREIVLFIFSSILLTLATFWLANFGATPESVAARLGELVAASCNGPCEFETVYAGFTLGMTIMLVFLTAAFIMVWALIFTDRSDDDIIIDQQQQLDAIQQLLLDLTTGNK